jgi:hypothetical protein
MSDWSLPQLLATLHEDIHRRLEAARRTFAHTTTKGDASERVWLQLLQQYLPQRYAADTAHVVDSLGQFSQQIDIVIFDRQYSPFILKYEGQTIIPAESVYAVFETKQAISTQHLKYAQEKIATVRRLHRTSLPIPHAGGVYPPKAPINILGGLLTFESTWPTCFGQPIREALRHDQNLGRINLGCVAAHGHFVYEQLRSAEQPSGNQQPGRNDQPRRSEQPSGSEQPPAATQLNTEAVPRSSRPFRDERAPDEPPSGNQPSGKERPAGNEQPAGKEQPRADEQPSGEYRFIEDGKPATAFLLRLISELQFSGTVPMIDVMSYAKWLSV